MKWNKITTRPLTDEEKEISPDYDFIYVGKTPEIDERVLVCANSNIDIYTWQDFGASGVGFEIIDVDIMYWMSFPEPPKE
ncbi:hypothetical protein [Streptococcus thoraltensis]|uniref:hypothetical protein n=1 Tax=Streptococcus thoraltensis TaxID=55085 RepID=UPI001F55B7B5|nr:hypothetical protein [Streptococcus thoraltensis]